MMIPLESFFFVYLRFVFFLFSGIFLVSCSGSDNPSSLASDFIIEGTWDGTETVLSVEGEDGVCFSSFEELIGTIFDISIILQKVDNNYNGRWINHSVNRNVGVMIIFENPEVRNGAAMGYIPFPSDYLTCDNGLEYVLSAPYTPSFEGSLSGKLITGIRETTINYSFQGRGGKSVKYRTFVSVAKSEL